MLNKITDRIYYMPCSEETDRPSLGLVCGEKYSLVIDTGNSPRHAKEFLAEAGKVNISPLRYAIITHYHWDHVFGIKEMNLTTIAHKSTEEKIKEIKSQKWDDESMEKMAHEGIYTEFTLNCIKKEIEDRDNFSVGDLDITIENSIKIDLGGISCIIEHIGGDHTDDSLIIYIPEEKVIFLGDCVYGRIYNGAYGYTTERLFPMIEEIKQYEAEHYLISHEKLYNKAQINELWDQLKTSGTLVGTDTSTEEAIKKYTDRFGRKPSEDEAFYMECFAAVNKVRS